MAFAISVGAPRIQADVLVSNVAVNRLLRRLGPGVTRYVGAGEVVLTVELGRGSVAPAAA